MYVSTDVEGDTTGETLHKESARLLDVPAERLRLVRRHGDGFLELINSQKLSEQEVYCNSVIVAVLRDEQGSWEAPTVELHRA